MPRMIRGSNDIADWGRTVKETLAQLGGSKPKKKPLARVQYSSLSQSSRTRQQSLGANRKRRQTQSSRNPSIR